MFSKACMWVWVKSEKEISRQTHTFSELIWNTEGSPGSVISITQIMWLVEMLSKQVSQFRNTDINFAYETKVQV